MENLTIDQAKAIISKINELKEINNAEIEKSNEFKDRLGFIHENLGMSKVSIMLLNLI